jgi:hypothetical protein
MPFPNLTEPELVGIVRALRAEGYANVDVGTVRGIADDFFSFRRPSRLPLATMTGPLWVCTVGAIERTMRARRSGVR